MLRPFRHTEINPVGLVAALIEQLFGASLQLNILALQHNRRVVSPPCGFCYGLLTIILLRHYYNALIDIPETD